MIDTDALARELHDVAFAWNHTMPGWDGMRDEDRLWFRERAARIVADGDVPPHALRTARVRWPSPAHIETARKGVREAKPNMLETIRKALGIPPAYTPPPFNKDSAQ